MLTLPFNPYTWDNTSDIMSSNIISLELKDDAGTPVVVENLNTSIEIVIPQSSGSINTPVTPKTFFAKKSKEGQLQYHYFNKGLEKTSMKITVYHTLYFGF